MGRSTSVPPVGVDDHDLFPLPGWGLARLGRFKFFGAMVDHGVVSTAAAHPHHLRASQADLMALARFWEWERKVAEHLPRVLEGEGLQIWFQPIFRISDELPAALGFEALSRFPVAPRIPVGLWFRTARDRGLARRLELAAIRAAIVTLEKVSDEAFLSVNASLDTVPELVAMVPPDLADRLIVDLPYSALNDRRSEGAFRLLRQVGAGVCIDDVPLEDLHVLRPILGRLRPDCIKVDMLNGLAENTMARFNLAEGAAWCQGADIELFAERVEHVADLVVLDEVGVEWAQGYCLSRPVLL